MAVTTITATGAGSQSFGAGTLQIEVWGGGSSQGNTGGIAFTGGAGAYSKTSHALASTTTVYYSNGGGGAYTGANTDGQNGGDSWANIVSNAAPTLTSQGALAKGGNRGGSGTAGTGGQSSSGIGATKSSGGNGASYDVGLGPNSGANYALPAGPGAGGPTANGGNAGLYTSRGAGNAPGGDGGNGALVNGSLTADVVAATAPTQPGGAAPYTAFSGAINGAAGWVRFTHTPAAQSLSASLLSSSSSILAATVSPGAVILSPGLLASSSILHAATVSRAAVTLSPGVLANSVALYGPAVTTGTVALSPGRLNSVSTFFPATVAQPGLQSLSAALLVNSSFIRLPTAVYDDAPGTYPQSIVRGGSVVRSALARGGSVITGAYPSTGRVIATALKGRP